MPGFVVIIISLPSGASTASPQLFYNDVEAYQHHLLEEQNISATGCRRFSNGWRIAS
jgi:hypothetical protein